MRLSALLGPDLQDVLATDPDALREALEEFHPEDVAEIVEDLPLADAVAIMRALPMGMSADVVERLSNDKQVEVLDKLPTDQAALLLSEVDPDDAADLVQELQELDEDRAEAILVEVEKADSDFAEDLRELVEYGPETAGGRMTTEFVSLSPETTATEAIDAVRSAGREQAAETVYYIYVCGYGDKLLGVASLRDVILAAPEASLKDLMREKVVFVRPDDDQEEVAQRIARYDLNAVPVVSETMEMLGVVTVDDVVVVVIEEATEDAQLMGGVVPLEDGYFHTGFFEFVWKRGIWLLVLFVGQMLTATVMERYEGVLAATVELVVFIPLIISSGGNAGSQSSTLIIRGMAVDEIALGDWLKVFSRELMVGLCLGAVLAALGFFRAHVTGEGPAALPLATAVGVSVLAVVTMGTVIGSLLPMLIQRAGLDPAVSSTPFIASLVDVLGLVAYFTVAITVLRAFS